MATHRWTATRSPSRSPARTTTHMGVVNSTAVTTASGASAMPHTQAYWPAKWTRLRAACSPGRRVTNARAPSRGARAERTSRETRLRKNRISMVGRRPTSRRAATDISTKEATDTVIQPAARRAAGGPTGGGGRALKGPSIASGSAPGPPAGSCVRPAEAGQWRQRPSGAGGCSGSAREG